MQRLAYAFVDRGDTELGPMFPNHELSCDVQLTIMHVMSPNHHMPHHAHESSPRIEPQNSDPPNNPWLRNPKLLTSKSLKHDVPAEI